MSRASVNPLRDILLVLPLTEEQWELAAEMVLKHEGARLGAVARLAELAPPGAALDVGIGHGYPAEALHAADPNFADVV